MSLSSLLTGFSRLSLVRIPHNGVRAISTYKPLLFKVTPCLSAEPLKKKKKMDPNILKQRDERRRKKLEKQIRRLEKHAKQYKPLDELEIPLDYLQNKEIRKRPTVDISKEDQERNVLLQKEWSRYSKSEYMTDIRMIDKIASSQTRALQALREISEELYNAAIELDHNLMPTTFKGPVKTPPIKNYDTPDGEYIDISKKWSN